jgi:RecB family exonuclease
LNVHDMMEWFWANFTTEQEAEVLALADDAPKARQLFYAAIPTPPEPYIHGEDEQIAQWTEWQFQRLLHTGGKQWRPTGVEANVHATRYVEVDGEAIPIHINGFIDTLFADDDGFALMELKTGKYKARSKVPSMRKEMAFYKMMLEHSKHAEFLPITHWGWEFPGGGINGGEGPTIYYEPTEKKWAAMKSVEKALEKLVKAHIDMDFPPDPWMGRKREDETLEDLLERNGMKCSWCDHREHCSFWSLTDEFLDEIMEEEQ